MLSGKTRGDALYSISSLGQADPSGNYLDALSTADHATFQAGSFDVHAHPGTLSTYQLTFYFPGGDVVQTNDLADPIVASQPSLVTSNNLGVNAGVANLDGYSGPVPGSHLALFYPGPHSVTPVGSPGEQTPVQSPGYLTWIWTSFSPPLGQYNGTVAGINDHQNLALTEYTFGTYAGQKTQAPYLYTTNEGDLNLPERNISLGTLGGTNGVANALNNSNQVVGWSQTASGAQHAFLYSNGTMQDLNRLIPPLSGITLTSAVGIDGSGRIVAYGTNASGQTEEFLLTPLEALVPEPSTLAVFGLVILALAARQVRSRCATL
jgi:probable HAF family extracellular repeat protein